MKLNSTLGKRRIRLQKKNHEQPSGKPALSGSAALRLNPKLYLQLVPQDCGIMQYIIGKTKKSP